MPFDTMKWVEWMRFQTLDLLKHLSNGKELFSKRYMPGSILTSFSFNNYVNLSGSIKTQIIFLHYRQFECSP